MSLRFIVGKPGGGKSFVATKMMLDDLANSEVMIITNVPLVWGECNAYLQTNYPKVSVDLHERLRILDDREVFEFYRYRSGGLELEPSPDSQEGKKMRKADFIDSMKAQFHRITESKDFQRPVHYYIDEAHNYFNAREWQEIGRALLYYVSQHRHLHDNIYLITQALANVEKQLKSVAQDYNVMRNMAKESIGIFHQKGVFRRRAYYTEPNGNAQHYEQSNLKLDFEKVGKCYKTCGALGLGYDQAETDRKPFKLPYWTLWGGAAALLVLGVFLIKTVPSMATSAFMGAISPETYQEKVSKYVDSGPSIEPVESSIEAVGLVVDPSLNGVRINGMYNLDEVWHVSLTDGRRLRTDRPSDGLEEIAKDYVLISGVRYLWAKPTFEPYIVPTLNSTNSGPSPI